MNFFPLVLKLTKACQCAIGQLKTVVVRNPDSSSNLLDQFDVNYFVHFPLCCPTHSTCSYLWQLLIRQFFYT